MAQSVIAVILPFLDSLVEKGLSQTSLRRHFGNAWLLGGEIVREIQAFPRERGKSALQLILEMVGPEGGPLCRHIDTEDQQRSFESTCRQLYRHLAGSR